MYWRTLLERYNSSSTSKVRRDGISAVLVLTPCFAFKFEGTDRGVEASNTEMPSLCRLVESWVSPKAERAEEVNSSAVTSMYIPTILHCSFAMQLATVLSNSGLFDSPCVNGANPLARTEVIPQKQLIIQARRFIVREHRGGGQIHHAAPLKVSRKRTPFVRRRRMLAVTEKHRLAISKRPYVGVDRPVLFLDSPKNVHIRTAAPSSSAYFTPYRHE